jgi:hypothetical protein
MKAVITVVLPALLFFFAMQALAANRSWLDLETLSVSTNQEPSGPRVEGTLEKDGRFVIREGAKVKGAKSAPERGDAAPGWVEIENRRFHSDVEAVSPKGPYVKGFQGRDGRFHPTSAEIHR